MLYNPRKKALCRHLLAGSVACIVGLMAFSCSDKYDLDTEQPSNLNTLYGYLEDKGNFTNFLQLIDDCDYTEVLSKTGSMTLFASDDDAFAEFYTSNDWGVKSYSQLSEAQKKLLLYSAMIGNAYPTSMLSTAEGPVKGEVCRRNSNQSLYDSVQVISTYSDELPQTELWTILRNHDEIVLFKDASSAPPMVHFTPKFLSSNKIESTDIDFLYNDAEGTRQSDDTYVNRAKITESQFCKNGFVHIVDRVITPLDNMAEIIRKNSQMSIFSGILERFAAPIDSSALTTNYNNNKGTDVDSVFVKRYFSDRTTGSTDDTSVALTEDKDGNAFDASLKFDPGWNAFVSEVYNDRDGMMEDMAVMMVPSDDAMTEWWENGGGKVIQDEYGTIENTPNSVLDELINVNMLNSLVESVPSRFDDILDDANEVMGVTLADIDSVYIGCNGVVYLTNKVFAPATYSSVLFPAVIDTENLSIIEDAIEELEYDAYLNSMVSTYSFFIPTNDGLLRYIDPVSFSGTTACLWEFHYDDSKSAGARIYAYVYPVDTATWTVSNTTITSNQTLTGGTSGNSYIENRMLEILDNIIGVEAATDDHHYILTKGKNYVKVGGTLDVEGSMTAAGTFEYETQSPYTVKQIYSMENGKSYVMDGVLTGTRKATSDILAETSEFSEFYELCAACGLFATSSTDGYSSASQNQGNSTRGNLVTLGTNSSGTETTYSLLNAYHYTVYVPTNDAMQIAYAAGLPTLDDVIAAEEYDELMTDNDVESDSAEHIYSIVRDFVKYHVQTNSLFLDGGFSTGEYESQRTQLSFQLDDDGNMQWDDDDEAWLCISGSPYRIDVTSIDASGMTLEDHLGYTINVDTSSGLYNIQAREYWLSGTTSGSSGKSLWQQTLENSSSVVIHAVDRPLLYSTDQFEYIPRSIVDDDSAKRRN